MAKEDLYNQSKKNHLNLIRRAEMHAGKVSKLFTNAVNELLNLTKEVAKISDNEVFRYGDNKRIDKAATDILRRLHASTYAAIRSDILLEWNTANDVMDEFIQTVFGKEIMQDPLFASWFSRDTDVIDSFLNRVVNGMGLSDRIWKTTEQLRNEMEIAMTVAIGEGQSASQISRLVRSYLVNPDKLFRRVRDNKGNLQLSKAAKAYQPGAGVYRSSYKNAMRVARTETNMAYRAADNSRAKQLDFIVGKRISLSRNHPVTDICDELEGDYPKWFDFPGWHPQCFCYMTFILIPEEIRGAYLRGIANGNPIDISEYQINDLPDNFNKWLKDNQGRINEAKRRGKLPYFLRDNYKNIFKNANTK